MQVYCSATAALSITLQVLCTPMPSDCHEQPLESDLRQTHLYERCQLILSASFGQEAIHSLRRQYS